MRGRKNWKKLLAGITLATMCVTSVPMMLSTNVRVVNAEEERTENQISIDGMSDLSEVFAKAKKPVNVNEHGYDIILVADHSESMWQQQEIRDQALRSISGLAAGSDIRIGVVYFAKDICGTKGLTSVEDKTGLESVNNFINMKLQNRDNMDTNIGNALEKAQQLFENQDETRKKVVILFSDGINTTEDADRKTREQVQKLKEDGADIYCVYLQKEKNEEEYLKQIVNYFDSTDTYTEERFQKVQNNELDTLSYKFAKIFYSSQNNMKYADIRVDSEGKNSFYIPALGVTKLQLYLKNPKSFGVKLTGPQDQKVEYYAEENTWFISAKTPNVGDWDLVISADEPEKTTGTVAYHVDLAAYAEMIGEKDENGNVFKNEEQQLNIYFFEENGTLLQADESALVTATVQLTDTKGEVKTQTLTLSNAGDHYESDGFKFEDYGTYTITTEIKYDDFIDLTYNMISGTVIGRAPIVYNQSKTFSAEKTKSGYHFTIEASELFEDPENEEVTFNVVQLNEKNPVKATFENGILSVVSKKTGNIAFAIDIEDETGLVSRLTVEGKVQNKSMMELVRNIMILLVLLFIIMQIRKANQKKKLVKQIEIVKTDFDREYKKILKLHTEMGGISYTELEEDWTNLIRSFGELSEEMEDDQIAQFELDTYLAENFVENKFHNVKKWAKDVNDRKVKMDEAKKNFSIALKNRNVSGLKKVLALYEKKVEEARAAVTFMTGTKENYEKEFKVLEDEYSVLEEEYFDIEESLNTPIQCNLILKWRGYIGDKNCKSGGSYIKGCYSLDQIKLMTDGASKTVKSILGEESTGIYVYGYTGEDGVGLELRSKEPFSVRNDAFGGDGLKVKKVALLKGETYKVTPEVGGAMTLIVK